ncbi:MAG: cryptochrome/photolyase family protein [Magnetovibrionaceae bacterium]
MGSPSAFGRVATGTRTPNMLAMVAPRPRLLWFREDLRLADHAALNRAARDGAPVVSVFVWDEETPGLRALGGARKWWLHKSLEALKASLAERGVPLILARGRAARVIRTLAETLGPESVHWMRRAEPGYRTQGREVAEALEEINVSYFAEDDFFLFPPESLKTGQGKPYGIFTPFWKACQTRPEPPRPTPVPECLQGLDIGSMGDALADWNLLPTKPDWAGGFRETWTPGEAGAQARLAAFIQGPVSDYAGARDKLGVNGTSGLSPHLAFGEISPRQVWHAAKVSSNAEPFVRQLGWREFAHHVLLRNPNLGTSALRDEFNSFPWIDDPVGLKAWQQGRTGYPLVDAGMRELWHTGTMHNRARMVCGSFLVKDLLIDWRAGESWFWDCLVDANEANNGASWQWVGGCGIDAAPYFRIFNPVLQSEKFDPGGRYIHRWVPELRDLPAPQVHAPWKAPEGLLRSAGVRLGETYPAPIVDHGLARDRALSALKAIKKT